MEGSIVENVTLFITAYKRRDTLKTLLPTLQGAPFPVVLLDSSPTKWELHTAFSDVEYRHTPEKLIYKVLRDAAAACETDYLCWDNDDDLVEVEGLIECVRTIEKNSATYSNVMGWQTIEGSDYGVKGATYWLEKQRPLLTVKERLSEMFKSFHTPVHSVMPAEVLRVSCDLVLKNPEWLPIRYFDRVVGVVQAIYGNKLFIDVPFLNRCGHSRHIDAPTYPEILDRKRKPRELLDVLKRNDPFSRLVFQREGTPVDSNRQMIYSILNTYVA